MKPAAEGTQLADELVMALLVEEVMNRELFSFKTTEYASDAIAYLLHLGISGAPVMNQLGRCVGVLSLRDLVGVHKDVTVDQLMSTPVITVRPKQTIAAAAKLMAEAEIHSLPVTDEHGEVIGLVSSLDLMRGLTGLPARHPRMFLHYDRNTNLQWSDDRELTFLRVESAPEEPGVLALVHGKDRQPERLVWVEEAKNIRNRLIHLMSSPNGVPEALQKWLEGGDLRFRAAVETDATVRKNAVAMLSAAMRDD